jgi:uncharacterized protein
MPVPEAPGVEVAYARPERQRVIRVPLTRPLTALEAVQVSGMIDEFPELAGCSLELGIFGRRIEPGAVLADGDRVEIYRPLEADPREARRAAARDRPAGGCRKRARPA